MRWAQRREILIRELREDMETLRLKIESEERMKLMEMKVILEKEARKARFLGLSKVKKGSTSSAFPKVSCRPDPTTNLEVSIWKADETLTLLPSWLPTDRRCTCYSSGMPLCPFFGDFHTR